MFSLIFDYYVTDAYWGIDCSFITHDGCFHCLLELVPCWERWGTVLSLLHKLTTLKSIADFLGLWKIHRWCWYVDHGCSLSINLYFCWPWHPYYIKLRKLTYLSCFCTVAFTPWIDTPFMWKAKLWFSLIYFNLGICGQALHIFEIALRKLLPESLGPHHPSEGQRPSSATQVLLPLWRQRLNQLRPPTQFTHSEVVYGKAAHNME